MPAPGGSAAALRDALDALPQKLRTVTVLHYMEGYDVSELSRLLHPQRNRHLPAAHGPWTPAGDLKEDIR